MRLTNTNQLFYYRDKDKIMLKKVAASISTTIAYVMVVSSVYAQELKAPAGSIKTDIKAESIPQFVVNWLSYIAITLAIIYLMYGGIRWMTSGGDKTKVESARKHIVAAVIGLVVVLGTFAMLQILFTVLGTNNPLQGGFKPPVLGQ